MTGLSLCAAESLRYRSCPLAKIDAPDRPNYQADNSPHAALFAWARRLSWPPCDVIATLPARAKRGPVTG